MNPETDYTDIIERYLDGEMEPSEEKSFAEKIANDPELASEVELHKTIRFGVENQPLVVADGDPFGARAFAEAAKAQRTKKKIINLRLRYGGVAAAAMISIIFLIFRPTAEYTMLDPFTNALRSNQSSNQFPELKAAYDQGQYDSGLAQIDSLMVIEINQIDYLTYLKGCFYLKKESYPEAISILEKLVLESSPNNQRITEIYWQLGVAQHKAGHKEEAEKVFEKLLSHPDLTTKEKEAYEHKLRR